MPEGSLAPRLARTRPRLGTDEIPRESLASGSAKKREPEARELAPMLIGLVVRGETDVNANGALRGFPGKSGISRNMYLIVSVNLSF